MMWFSALSWRLDTGFPWTRAYINYEILESLSTYLFEQVSSQRMQPNVGLSLQWVDRKWDVYGDVLIGSVIQMHKLSNRVHQENFVLQRKSPKGQFDLRRIWVSRKVCLPTNGS